MAALSAAGAVPTRLTVRAHVGRQGPPAARGLGQTPQLVPCRRRASSMPPSDAPKFSPRTTAARALFSWDFSGMKSYLDTIEKGNDVSKPFDQTRWSIHQNAWRHLRHILDFFQSRVLARISGALLWVTAVSTAACCLLTFGPANLAASLTLPMTPFSLTAGTLGLLLVFRTTGSYSRWDEARKMWGLMVNRTRDMHRQYAAFFPPPLAAEKRAWMQRWTVAFVYSLKCHLREKDGLEAYVKDVLLPEELSELMASQHKPLYALQCLTAGINGSGANTYIKGIMDQNLTAMEDVVGGCERLLRTPLPLSYTRHTTRFLKTWLTLLPFGLYSTCGWSTIPFCTAIAFFMLGVEEIGVHIEEPFKILALDALCATIAANTKVLAEGSTLSGTHSSHGILKRSVNIGDGVLSADEKLANAAVRLEIAANNAG